MTWLQDLCKIFRKDVDENIHHVADRAFNDRRYFVDSTKLEKLGWEQKKSWAVGLVRGRLCLNLKLTFCTVRLKRWIGTWMSLVKTIGLMSKPHSRHTRFQAQRAITSVTEIPITSHNHTKPRNLLFFIE